MVDTTGKSIGLAQQSNRQSRVIIEKTGLFGRCSECSFRCGNAAMRTWQGRTNSYWVCLLDLPTSNLEAPGPQQ